MAPPYLDAHRYRPAIVAEWMLDPRTTYLNHGSFGAVPAEVLDTQHRLRSMLEANPTRFMARELPDLIGAARQRLAAFVGADPLGLVFVANATTGVNAVLRSLPFDPGDEIVVTDHGYNSCRNVADVVAAQTGARVVEAHVPFPITGPGDAIRSIQDVVTDRTALVMVDHVTSPTALVFPVAEIVEALKGIPVLVDGAHGPGMVPLDVDSLGAAFYTGNCHKWMCAPKGAGFLWVADLYRDTVVPGTISHGWNEQWPGENRLHRLFDYTGTDDPTAWLSVPAAIDVMKTAVDGGWDEIMARNHRLAVDARDLLLEVLASSSPSPTEMLGAMASVVLPAGDDDLREMLYREHQIEVPVFPWGRGRILRISAQIYNDLDEYKRLSLAITGI